MAVPVVDLHDMSMEFIKEHGLHQSGQWFYPSDYTHTMIMVRGKWLVLYGRD